MSSTNLRNNELEFTPTFGTQLHGDEYDGNVVLSLASKNFILQDGSVKWSANVHFLLGELVLQEIIWTEFLTIHIGLSAYMLALAKEKSSGRWPS